MNLAQLTKRRAIIIADLLGKVEAEDWHGVADAAMDLREIDAMLRVLIDVDRKYAYTVGHPA
jgi:hypothetical protein